MNNGIARITRTTFFRLALTSSIFFGAVQLRADVVTDWNQTTVRALNAGEVGFAKQTRATAMVHVAMFDALTTATAPNNAVRAYHSFSGAADECGSSRVWLGYHFRTAVRDGLREGELIGQWASHRLLPVDGRDED